MNDINFFLKDLTAGVHINVKKDHHLDPVFLELLLSEFERLSEYSLLLRCLPGYSQNANERSEKKGKTSQIRGHYKKGR